MKTLATSCLNLALFFGEGYTAVSVSVESLNLQQCGAASAEAAKLCETAFSTAGSAAGSLRSKTRIYPDARREFGRIFATGIGVLLRVDRL
jgi:hypothetical protein